MKGLCFALLLALSSTVQAQLRLSYLGQQVVETGREFQGLPLGGLSSIEFDPKTGHYLAISDDRSEHGPARFYELALDLREFRRSATPGDAGVRLLGMTPLLDLNGKTFARSAIDPEGLRLDAARGLIYWTNEGERTSQRFLPPTVRRMSRDGKPAGEFAIPRHFLPKGSAGGLAAGDQGVYNNLAFESLTLTPDGKTLWTATENALTQDGLPADVTHGSKARMLSFDLDTGRAGAEFVYEVEPVPLPPIKPGDFATNGLVELLALSGHEFIAMERGFAVGAATPGLAAATGRPTGNTVRLYQVSTRDATDVSAWPSIKGHRFKPVSKQLLLDLATLRNDDGMPVALDNIEGISFGPVIDGKRTLVLISDNNFNARQFTQFIALTLESESP